MVRRAPPMTLVAEMDEAHGTSNGRKVALSDRWASCNKTGIVPNWKLPRCDLESLTISSNLLHVLRE